MKISELAYGGVWVASAIAVAGYSWTALTGEYAKFPAVNTSDPNANQPPNAGPLSALPFGDFGYNWIQNARHNVGNWMQNAAHNVGNAMGSGPSTPTQKKAENSGGVSNPNRGYTGK